MLNKLEMALMMDWAFGPVGALWMYAPGRSRRGILSEYPALGAAQPTWDPLNGRFTVDGSGDYFRVNALGAPGPFGNDAVLSAMGSIQNETYILYFDPFMASASTVCYIGTDDGADPNWYIGNQGADSTDSFEAHFTDVGGLVESVTTPVSSILEFAGKQLLLVLTREPTHATVKQRVYCNGVERWTANSQCRDASHLDDMWIGDRASGGDPLPAGTGLRFIGYAQQLMAEIQVRAIQRFIRGLL